MLVYAAPSSTVSSVQPDRFQSRGLRLVHGSRGLGRHRTRVTWLPHGSRGGETTNALPPRTNRGFPCGWNGDGSPRVGNTSLLETRGTWPGTHVTGSKGKANPQVESHVIHDVRYSRVEALDPSEETPVPWSPRDRCQGRIEPTQVGHVIRSPGGKPSIRPRLGRPPRSFPGNDHVG